MASMMNKILDLSAAVGLYDWWARGHLGEVYDALVELANLHGDEEVLDVGCGTGILSSRLAKASDRLTVCGLDVGPHMIRAAEESVQTHHPRAEYRVGTVVQLPYSDRCFDAAVSCLLFHLLQGAEKERALREIFRILKPGGRYVCAEFETYPSGLFGRHLSLYPTDLIEAVGFEVHAWFRGPSITRRRPVVYRVLTRPNEDRSMSGHLAERSHPEHGHAATDQRERPS